MSLELLILGSNAAAFAHGRHHTSQFLRIQDHNFLIDCGEGTQLLLKRNKIRLSKIDHIVISHLHGDHYFGLIGLISTFHLFGRKRKLTIVGPPGLKEITSLQLKYSETSLSYKVDFIEFEPDVSHIVFEDDKILVSTIPMDHRVPCSGYFFQEKPKKWRLKRDIELPEFTLLEIVELKNGRNVWNEDGSVKYAFEEYTDPPTPPVSYAYCSDSKLNIELTEQVNGTDLLYHEATFADDMEERAENTYHSTARQAAMFALSAHAKKLLLGHFSARYRELDPIINEARSVFPGAELAIEGRSFKV